MPAVAMIICQQILKVTNIWLELYFWYFRFFSAHFIHLTNIQYLPYVDYSVKCHGK